VFNKNQICVIVGLQNELNALNNLNVNSFIGYGEFGANKVVNQNLQYYDCFISMGFAGSIDQKLKNGDILIPQKVVWKDGSVHETDKKYRNFLLNKIKSKKVSTKNLTSVKEIINNSEEKKKIKHKYDVSAIDMESESIQKITIKEKKIFVVVRVILDDCQFSIPNYIVKSTNRNGLVNNKQLFLHILKNPGNILSLIKLSFYYIKAYKILKSLCKMIFNN